MIRTKIAFGIFIMFITALLLFSLTFYKGNNIIENSLATGYTFLETTSAHLLSDEPPVTEKPITVYDKTAGSSDSNSETGSCIFRPPINKTIILRLDDVGAWHYDDAVVNITNDILSRNMSIAYGVIPEGLEKDQKFISFIETIRDNPKVEITQHGNHHLPSEFKNLTGGEAFLQIKEGQNLIVNNLKVSPITFVPPSNDYNEGTIQALKDNGFRVVSARDSEFKSDGLMNFIGGDIETFDFFNQKAVSVNEVVLACQKALDQKNLCVITIHPQDYTYDDNPGVIDQTQYSEFLNLLESLKVMDADFKTFKDLVQCS